MTFEMLCPCGSQITYSDCCSPYHTNAQVPPTALLLMRSRFSDFALHNTGYLLQTWAENTRPATLDLSDDPTVWQELKIVRTQKGGVGDRTGQVEFKAYYTLSGEQYVLHETSRFIKTQERWFYVDGVIKAAGLVALLEKQPKNALCLCGSGKKYKRCCGAI
ncbi:MAG: YchJ family protein [Methylococcales bacterium]